MNDWSATSQVLFTAGIVVLALACFTSRRVVVRKLGGLCILGATFLTGYFVTGRIWAGVVLALVWFLIPWLEILTRIRRLRLPVDKRLRHRTAPSRDRFPSLPELTEEVEAQGFEHVGDTGWEWDDLSHYARVFYSPDNRAQAAIALNEQGPASIAYLSLASRTPGGEVWMTWSYPFAPSMKFGPRLHLQRATQARSFEELLDLHERFLLDHGLVVDDLATQRPDEIEHLLQKDIRDQIDHNLDIGLIKLSGEGTFRYSWRGLFFLWRQFLKDLVRLS